MTEKLKDYMKTAEAAEFLGVSQNTLRTLRNGMAALPRPSDEFRAKYLPCDNRLEMSKMNSSETYRGVVHGSTIELRRSPGVPDGMEVDVVIKRTELTASERQEQLKALFGSCKDDAEALDEFLKWNDEQRKRNRTGQES